MLAMEITSFLSGSPVTAFGGTGAGVGADTLSLQAASAKASRTRNGTRIGARKIAEAGPAHKQTRRRFCPAVLRRRRPAPRRSQQVPRGAFLLFRVAQERGRPGDERPPLVAGVALALFRMRTQVVAQDDRVAPERGAVLHHLGVEGDRPALAAVEASRHPGLAAALVVGKTQRARQLANADQQIDDRPRLQAGDGRAADVLHFGL